MQSDVDEAEVVEDLNVVVVEDLVCDEVDLVDDGALVELLAVLEEAGRESGEGVATGLGEAVQH